MKKGIPTSSDDIPKIDITGTNFDGIKDVCEDEFDGFVDELERIRRSKLN